MHFDSYIPFISELSEKDETRFYRFLKEKLEEIGPRQHKDIPFKARKEIAMHLFDLMSNDEQFDLVVSTCLPKKVLSCLFSKKNAGKQKDITDPIAKVIDESALKEAWEQICYYEIENIEKSAGETW